ncbi:MAG: GNAT family N-acetyltransferase [Dyadobacter sp.]
MITTDRLVIKPLSTNDDNFILELVNTEGWIKFIGNRNIGSPTEANAYIQKVLGNKNLFYWVVKLVDDQQAIGIVTFIKRDYLEHHDIGFAFLPTFSKNGYAYEATHAVLNKLIMEQKLLYILATTVPENESSIRLLKKVGLVFEKEIEIENEKLHVYGASLEKMKD